ncbi:MAG: hypothetical protein KAR19_15000 [Bacteroidales bacterium]|nr:hypothetical protein [Bacteroidales bacterium]
METIKLPETELTEMKQFYQEEHDKAVRRLQHIKTMLQRLGVNIQSFEPETIQMPEIPAGEVTPAEPSVSKTKKKTGRKSKWELLIMKRLRQLDKPVTYDELTEEIMTFSKIPENKRISTKQAVVNVIFRLRNRDKKLDTFSIGTREKYIALRRWFENPGEIKKEYAAKIANPKSKIKAKPGRPGRPKKKAHS